MTDKDLNPQNKDNLITHLVYKCAQPVTNG